MTSDDQAPIPGFVHAFDMFVERGAAVVVGQLAAGGRRVHVPVNGGTVTGTELAGVLMGGSETLLERGDGVTVVEANYLIRTGDGAFARAFGHGYRTDDREFAGTRLALLFEADANGPLADLARRAFVAEALPGDAQFAVMRID